MYIYVYVYIYISHPSSLLYYTFIPPHVLSVLLYYVHMCIGGVEEVSASRDVAQRGVQLIATVHGTRLRDIADCKCVRCCYAVCLGAVYAVYAVPLPSLLPYLLLLTTCIHTYIHTHIHTHIQLLCCASC
jgi:hypothetical protein